MSNNEQFKARVVVGLRWVSWACALILAVLFVSLNMRQVEMNCLIGTLKTPAALIYSFLFLMGWYAGSIFKFTVEKVKKIEEKYRETMTLPEGPPGELQSAAAAPGTSPPSTAPAPVESRTAESKPV